MFYYDAENQLVSVTVSNAWRSEFQYDGFMRRRIRKEFTWNSGLGTWNLTNEVRYIYDGRLVVQERDANNFAHVSYTRGNDLSGTMQGAGGIGGLLARSAPSTINSPLSTAFYHADGNGNSTALVSSNQIIVARYHYDPYGNTLSASGPLADANLYRFSSKEYHPNSGLVYYLYRYYDPNLQRWVNRDPIGEAGGINLYCLVFNMPGRLIDMFGLDPCDWFEGTFGKTPKESWDDFLREFLKKPLDLGNRENLPHHGKPKPALSLMLNEFTEKKLRGPGSSDS